LVLKKEERFFLLEEKLIKNLQPGGKRGIGESTKTRRERRHQKNREHKSHLLIAEGISSEKEGQSSLSFFFTGKITFSRSGRSRSKTTTEEGKKAA